MDSRDFKMSIYHAILCKHDVIGRMLWCLAKQLSWARHLRATGCHLPYVSLPSTWHKWTHPSQTGWYLTYLLRRDWLDTEMVYLPADGHHPSTIYRHHIRPGIELATCWSQVRRPNHYQATQAKPHDHSIQYRRFPIPIRHQ